MGLTQAVIPPGAIPSLRELFQLRPGEIFYRLIWPAVTIYVVYSVIQILYRLFGHPLKKIPGPFLAAISDAWYGYVLISGRSIHIIEDLHRKYGPVVRIAPNQLSFATISAFKDIYGRSTTRKLFTKTEFYDWIGGQHVDSGSGTERDPIKHEIKRKLLAPMLSNHAILKFEDMLQSHVDLFLKNIETPAGQEKGADLTEWFNYLTFDISGMMILGEDFGAVAAGKPHFWMSLIVDNADVASYMEAAGRFSIFKWLIKLFIADAAIKACQYHVENTKKKLMRVMNELKAKAKNQTVMMYLLENQQSKGISSQEITSHATEMIVAGSETTATTLIVTLYYLMSTPYALKKLTEEIRTTFASYSDITALRSADLPYLTAAIREGMRVGPAAPIGFPRYSPGETVDGLYVPEGVQVFAHIWTLSRSPDYFKEPEKYIPERWTDPNNTDEKSASQPFLMGTRQCSGQNLAWIEVRLVLAKLLYLYDVELVDKNKEWMGQRPTYFLLGKAPLNVRMKRREGMENILK